MKRWNEYTKDEQRKLKKILKIAFKSKAYVPNESLMTESRYYYSDNDYDNYTEYGFLGYNLTDEEVAEMVDDMWLRVRSPYDCSGERFTCWIDTHRNPSGLVSFVHRIGIDV